MANIIWATYWGGLFGNFFRLGFINVRISQVLSAGGYDGQEWHVVTQLA